MTSASASDEVLIRGSTRRRAAAVLESVLTTRSRAEPLLAKASRDLASADRRLLFELVLGTLRWKRRIDWVLESASRRKMAAIDSSLRWPLRLGIYQLLFLDRMPAYAVVDEAVSEVRRRGLGQATGFANAVLRRVAERRSLEAWPVDAPSQMSRLAIETSHPDFLVERWLARFGSLATRSLLDANNAHKPMHLLCTGNRQSVATELMGEGVETSTRVMSPLGLLVVSGDALQTRAFRSGRFYVQDDASQCAALVPGPRPFEKVIDLASAPGGKSFALLTLEPRLRLTAADASLARVGILASNRRRLGVKLPAVVCDARVPAFTPNFDRVVVDLPCSGTGTIARHPELKWRLEPGEINRLAGRSLDILTSASSLVRAGGLLCAITCSLEEEENELLMERLFERAPAFEPLSLDGRLPASLTSGVHEGGMWRVLTTAQHDGFTVHVARRADGD